MYSNNLPIVQQQLSYTQLPPLQPQMLPPQPPPNAPPEVAGKKRTKKDRACDLCRRKKIRCDYDQAYPKNSCASCKSYNKTCEFKEAAKKRGPPKGYVEGLESRLKRMEKLLMNIAANGNLPEDAMKAVMEGSSLKDGGDDERSDGDDSHASRSDDTEQPPATASKEHSPTDADRVKDAQEIKPIQVVAEDRERIKEPFSYVGSSSGIYLLSRLFTKDAANLDTEEKQALPRPLEGHEEDLMIVRFGGDPLNKLGFGRILNPDWKMPPKDLVDHMIAVYFEKMNPMLPILDEDLFYKEYRKANHAHTFTPIIMTLCRVTSRILKKDDPFLTKYNIDRSTFFRDISKQISLYFDLDFLEPKIETIQVLLLNASNAEKWGLESTDWITTSIAVKMAQDLGLHRANTQQEGIPKKAMEAKKRLWWSAYIIDRWVCASLGRPLTISDADCDVEYPDSLDKKYSMFIYLVKLSCILGDVLRALCSPRARLMSEKGVGLENISHSLEQMLLDWKTSLPTDLKLTEDELSRISRKEVDPGLDWKLNNGAGKLHLTFCAVYMLIKRPFISLGIGNASNVTMPSECREAIKISVDIFDIIDPSNLLCGWSLSSYCTSQNQTLLFLNFRNADANLIAESKSLAYRFKNRHHVLAEYITEPSIVPFLDILSNVIGGEWTSSNETAESFQSKENETILDQQANLWGASSGIEWQEMVKLLAETGYQA
ncbi:fungal-specific transcription factor domain-containing protein [Parasitella parasitica]|nr:fungal-specific transcription factor domain-containing protein [Parasitella parasitica]